MSQKYPGGVISKTAPVPSGPYANSTAPGIWTLDQQAAYAKQGNWPTAGNVDPSAFIENLFSTYLYTGNGSTQTITNGIDLAGKGGLVWTKQRSSTQPHALVDTVRGQNNWLQSNTTDAQINTANLMTFSSAGYGIPNGFGILNSSAETYASWTFREQPKFFDVVTWTGNDAASRQIAHNLGSTPGCVIVKATNNTLDWFVSHRSLATANAYLNLNTTAASATGQNWGNSGGTRPTSTDFTVGDNTNISGYTYVAYLFAHDAGGFGLTGTDNVISCGSCSSDSSGYIQPVNLGYEPQWVMLKRTNSAANWVMMDTMRGMANTAAAASPILLANTSAAEAATGVQVNPTATGFEDLNWGGWGASNTYIYIAIRRGPMKVPTTGTSVFTPATRTGTSATANITSAGFPVDLALIGRRNTDGLVTSWDRLRGAPQRLITSATSAESSSATGLTGFDSMTGFSLGNNNTVNDSTYNYVDWDFRRAPSFFDEVCYLGNGSTQTITHNLGVVPELIIGKNRTTAGNNWPVLFNFASTTMNYGFLNLTNSCPNDTYANVGVFSAAPTSTSMFLVNSGSMNTNTNQHVAYLFASCAGVSKVFSYTGNGSSQTINCGFTGGARFVLIKRTDSTGDWYVWDSARGIVSGNDPHLSLNSTAAEVTTDDTIDTDSTGFVVNQVSATNVNVSSATYIGFAVA